MTVKGKGQGQWRGPTTLTVATIGGGVVGWGLPFLGSKTDRASLQQRS